MIGHLGVFAESYQIVRYIEFMRWLGILIFAITVSSAAVPERPKIGLALEGGGALGFAHIGVLQWFEANHIPIDAIAGTSMGAFVGGLYAAGKSPQDIQTLLGGLHWDDILQSQPPFGEVSFRRKEDRIAFPNSLDFGWRKGIALPAGLNSGQQIDFILDRTLLSYRSLKSFDDLPIPFRCVATELISGKEKDFDRGSLADAIDASMSIPSIFIPATRDGAFYTDGGSVNNLPVDLAKTMNVDIVIAVYLDGGPPPPDFQKSLVGIAGRTASIMVAANEMHSMQAADILLTADVKAFATGEFARYPEIIPRGFDAAQKKRALLSRFALTDEEWRKHLAARHARERTDTPVPQFVTVTGTKPDEKSSLERALAGEVGKPVDSAQLEDKLTALNAQGAFSSLSYGVVQKAGADGLEIAATRKANGPPFVNLGLNIDGSDPNDVRFGLRGRLTFLNLGGLRSEWRTDVAFGNRYEISTEYYHPLSESSNWFLAPRAYAGKSRYDIYGNRTRQAEYSFHRAGAGLDLGYAIGRYAEIRLGEELIRHESELKLGTPFSANTARTWGDTSLVFQYFGQDDTVVPHQGLSTQTRIDWLSSRPFGGSYRSAETKWRLFVPVSERGSLLFSANAGSAFGATNLGLESFTLGGPFRLGAYGIHELMGNQYLLFQAGYSRRLLNFNPLFGGALYGLAWYEAGKMYGDPMGPSLPMDGSVAIVAKTVLGPVFAGSSIAGGDRFKWWFGVGRIF